MLDPLGLGLEAWGLKNSALIGRAVLDDFEGNGTQVVRASGP
jgi:hypothetical protein